jgi:UDP-N-acetyl-D-mannosaminuronic acid transferase (WecB/TagA/CpsF family)
MIKEKNMKIQTTQVVTITEEEVIRLLKKMIEKKTGKIVSTVNREENSADFSFTLETEVNDLDNKES